MYDDGEGVLQDYVEAHMWFNLAVAQFSGEERATIVVLRDAVTERMTTDQVVEAQRRAREWDAAHPRAP
jgi:TPR repeat protein